MIQQMIVDYLCNLINIDTTNGSNNEIEGVLYIKKVFDEIGIENKIYEPVSGKGNIIAVVKGESENSILLHSHIDTVDYNAENWLFPPNKASIVNNCVVGRGALDCKGLVAIWMAILKDLYLNKKPKNTIIFMCSCDEESDGLYGTKWLCENTDILENIKLVFGEGGGYPIPLGDDFYFTIQTEEIYIYNSKESNTVDINYTDDKIKEIFDKAIKLGYYNENTLKFYNNRNLQAKRKIAEQCFYENIYNVLNKKVNYKKLFNLVETKLRHVNQNYKLLPIITPGYSDNRFFRQRGIPTIGFFPLDTTNNISGIHGNNEYISFRSLRLSYKILSKIINYFAKTNF